MGYSKRMVGVLLLVMLLASGVWASAQTALLPLGATALGQQVWEWLLVFLASGTLFVLPGWALLQLWPAAARLTWPEQAGLATGIGMALYPVLMLVTSSFGLNLGAIYAWLPPVAALLLLLWKQRQPKGPVACEGWRAREVGGNGWPNAALVVVFTLIIGVRCVAVVGLEVPLWGDSVHHTMIAQLMIEQGGLFRSWAPYAAMQSFTYHFGFHSQVAVLAWITHIATPRMVVLSGQVDNIAAVCTLYPLALRLGRSRWAGVAALLLAGLLAPMPMMYVNWGRYTQLAGQAILPVGLYLAWELLATPKRSWALWGLTVVTLAGMALTHYRIAIFAACFFPAFALVLGIRLPWRVWIERGALLGVGVGLLVLPWVVRVLGGQLLTILMSIFAASTQRGTGNVNVETLNVIGDPLVFLPALIWYGMLLSVFWAIWRREQGALLVAFWWLLVILIVNPQLLGMPGAGMLTNFALMIAAYIPAALIVGAAAGWLLRGRSQRFVQRGATLVVVALALWGGSLRLADVDQHATAMVTPADLRAIAWIQTNTPPDARFLVNAFFPNAGAVVGSDAGWWLALLAHRPTTLPPLLYIAEQGPRPDYRQWLNQLYATMYAKGVGNPDALALLRERGITYVYLGELGGKVGYTGTDHILTPELLQRSPAFRPVYHAGQVWIFALQPE